MKQEDSFVKTGSMILSFSAIEQDTLEFVSVFCPCCSVRDGPLYSLKSSKNTF